MSTKLPSAASEMTVWRHDLHAHPEFGFELTRTAAFVADKLRSFGFDEVVEGVGRVGVGGTLRRGSAGRAIALRIEELGDRPHRSRSPGLMHACGHDGHTAMLLGAAKLLAAEGGFDGTVRFLFRPRSGGAVPSPCSRTGCGSASRSMRFMAYATGHWGAALRGGPQEPPGPSRVREGQLRGSHQSPADQTARAAHSLRRARSHSDTMYTGLETPTRRDGRARRRTASARSTPARI